MSATPVFLLRMDATNSLCTSLSSPNSMLDLAQKVVRTVLIPFAFLFDLLVNSLRVVTNVLFSIPSWIKRSSLPPPPHIPVQIASCSEDSSEGSIHDSWGQIKSLLNTGLAFAQVFIKSAAPEKMEESTAQERSAQDREALLLDEDMSLEEQFLLEENAPDSPRLRKDTSPRVLSSPASIMFSPIPMECLSPSGHPFGSPATQASVSTIFTPRSLSSDSLCSSPSTHPPGSPAAYSSVPTIFTPRSLSSDSLCSSPSAHPFGSPAAYYSAPTIFTSRSLSSDSLNSSPNDSTASESAALPLFTKESCNTPSCVEQPVQTMTHTGASTPSSQTPPAPLFHRTLPMPLSSMSQPQIYAVPKAAKSPTAPAILNEQSIANGASLANGSTLQISASSSNAAQPTKRKQFSEKTGSILSRVSNLTKGVASKISNGKATALTQTTSINPVTSTMTVTMPSREQLQAAPAPLTMTTSANPVTSTMTAATPCREQPQAAQVSLTMTTSINPVTSTMTVAMPSREQPQTAPAIAAAVDRKPSHITIPTYTKAQETLIDTLLFTLATTNPFKLGMDTKKKEELMRIGKEIQNLHPLTFLLCILGSQNRIGYLKEIFSNPLKLVSFMSYSESGIPSFEDKLIKESKNDGFYHYLMDFAKQTKINLRQLLLWIPVTKAKDFVEFLIKNAEVNKDAKLNPM